MNLLDMFRKSKKTNVPYLGKMWACAVKFHPSADPGRRYGVVIKNVGIVEAFVRDGEARVLSDEQNPFNGFTPVRLAGPVGRLEYVQSSEIWIGFFETEDEAKDEYRRFAGEVADEIKSASAGLGLSI